MLETAMPQDMRRLAGGFRRKGTRYRICPWKSLVVLCDFITVSAEGIWYYDIIKFGGTVWEQEKSGGLL